MMRSILDEVGMVVSFFCGKPTAIKNLKLVFYNTSTCLVGDSAAYQRTNVYGDDMVIVAAYWTILCKSKRGCFKNTSDDDLLASVLRALIEKTNLNLSEVRDIVMGTVLEQGSQRASECRLDALYVGFPETVPIRTVNRQCSFGLQVVAGVAVAIKEGFYEMSEKKLVLWNIIIAKLVDFED